MASDPSHPSSDEQWRSSGEDHPFELLRITNDSWRLVDQTVPAGNADYLVAFVQRVSATYEIVWLRAGVDCKTFESLDDVLVAARTADRRIALPDIQRHLDEM